MDGGAQWAAVHGVAQSWTGLSDFTFTFHLHALEKEMATHSSVLFFFFLIYLFIYLFFIYLFFNFILFLNLT